MLPHYIKVKHYICDHLLSLTLNQNLCSKRNPDELLPNKSGDGQLYGSLQWSFTDTSGTTTQAKHQDTTLHDTTPKDPDTMSDDTPHKDIDNALHNTDLDTMLHDATRKDLDTTFHDRDVDTTLHDTNIDTTLSDTGLDTTLSDTGFDTTLHDTGLDTTLHDTDLDTMLHTVNKSSSPCASSQDWTLVNKTNSTGNLDRYCHMDDMCMFYSDCCVSRSIANLRTEDVLAVILNQTKSYLQLVQFFEAYRWYQMTTCESWVNLSMVTKCSEDEDILVKFIHLHNKLNQPSEKGSLFLGLTQEDIISRCHRAPNPQDPTLYRIPVTLDTGNTKVDFRNILCAICNGLEPASVTPWEAEFYCPNCSVSFNKQSYSTKIQQIVIKKSRKLRSKFYFSLQDLTCIWKSTMLASIAINETEMTLQLMGDLKTVIETALSELPILQVNTSFCPETNWTTWSDDIGQMYVYWSPSSYIHQQQLAIQYLS